MKNIIRQKTSIHTDIMELLNEQIFAEQHASSAYLAMASWCDQNGYLQSTEFFYKNALEEREHMMKIFKYILDNGGASFSPEVSNINHEFESIKDVVETALDMEISVTQKIYNLVKECRRVGDIGTEVFLQWFVTEQLEEEQKFRDILDMIHLMDGAAQQFIDERMKNYL
ncbi:ferritin [Aureivirga marina]|uniref:ferritin n=1 Tax=Aureivirga marina TaxID=1182451 RepID=UPI0018C93DEC|nr:ferritin [Aureivirga marina]